MQNLDPLRQITPEALAMLGAPDIAYVRPVIANGQRVYGIFGADGSQMAVAADRDVAFAVVRQNGMDPVSVH